MTAMWVFAWLGSSAYLFTHPLELRGIKRKTQLKIMLLVFASEVGSVFALAALVGESLVQ